MTTNNEQYVCSICHQLHLSLPAIAFTSPEAYQRLTDQEQAAFATLEKDFCIIENPEQVDRFIRAVMIQDLTNDEDELHYGVWVSLSEESFKNYQTHFGDAHHETQYFGWLSSLIPNYPSTLHIPTTVITQKDNQRPLVFPHKDFEHVFVRDFYDGISRKQAEEQIHSIFSKEDLWRLSTAEPENSKALKKAWWRFW